MTFNTQQEEFWAGQFGNAYADRNTGNHWVASGTALFATILKRTHSLKSVIEFGANIGMNLLAIQRLLPHAELSAVEINEYAAGQLRENVPSANVHRQSIVDFHSTAQWDLAFTKGVLIHIDPDVLARVYDVLYAASRRYILVVEYYNPSPVEVEYRGHAGKLFKRDFAGDLLDRYDGLQLVDYGFVYRRDTNFPQDDMTWFLLRKHTQNEIPS